MVTIKDVARHANVSVASASYALNRTGTISASTRKRVLAAADELNYHPNAFARNLKNRKTRTIGVFIARFGGAFYEEILEGIHDAVLKTDYELLVCPESQHIQKILTHRQVDGAIIFESKVCSDIILRLASEIYPIIVLDRYLEADYLLPLLIDNQQGTKDAFHHLYDQGARRILCISGAEDSYDNLERMQAFLNEAGDHQIKTCCYQGNFTEESGYDTARLIFNSKELPEAVFCANDQMAIGFIKAMQEKGIRVPEDIAVIGFDDIPIAKYLHPSLSTIGVSRWLWGSLAATQLIGYLENRHPFQPARIPTRLIPRESSVITHNILPPITGN